MQVGEVVGEVVDDVDVEIVEAVSEQSGLIDPSEIEIITDGISFIDSNDNKEGSSTNEQAEDTGIVFLD